jgi:hypothetical protein
MSSMLAKTLASAKDSAFMGIISFSFQLEPGQLFTTDLKDMKQDI